MSGPGEVLAPALAALEPLARAGRPVIAAVDGRCGSGKTTLAALAAERFGCAVVHMDDFYLPPERRQADWRRTPGANMDLDRLRREILEPFRAGKRVSYRPYRCGEGRYGEPVSVPAGGLVIVEGSYSLHPRAAAGIYALKIFLTCSPETQQRRLQAREGAHFAAFQDTWIPLEEAYLRLCGVDRDAVCIDTTAL